MIVVPELIPYTIPVVLPIDALADRVLLHRPPAKPLLSVMLWNWHTSPGPVIAVGSGLMVTVFCAGQPPTKYWIVSIATVSEPVMVAVKLPVVGVMVPSDALVLFHVPPGVKSL